jgi:hypothetical protein
MCRENGRDSKQYSPALSWDEQWELVVSHSLDRGILLPPCFYPSRLSSYLVIHSLIQHLPVLCQSCAEHMHVVVLCPLNNCEADTLLAHNDWNRLLKHLT